MDKSNKEEVKGITSKLYDVIKDIESIIRVESNRDDTSCAQLRSATCRIEGAIESLEETVY